MDSTRIGFHIAESPLGALGVAATERGVCHICFAEDAAEVEAALRAEFPWVDLREESERLAPWVAALQRHLRGESRALELPLDVRGSQFQRRVWNAIAAVPYGRTRAYADLAADIGQPRAARAVAKACAANPVAIAIPCHRIVGRRGALGGYRYGIDRKRALLEQESALPEEKRADLASTQQRRVAAQRAALAGGTDTSRSAGTRASLSPWMSSSPTRSRSSSP